MIKAHNTFGILAYWKEILILTIFSICFSLISFVNHYNFRTSAFDLGMFNHALYSFSHGKINYFTLDIVGNAPLYFADHFSPMTILYVPFYYIFGSWTLLIIQIIAILFGSIGIYKLAVYRLPNFKYHYLILILFLGQWALVSALAFDFHNNVVAAMFVPWFFYFYFKKRKTITFLFFLLILISKENMSLWMTFILLGIILKDGIKISKQKFREFLHFEIPLLIISLIYFYVVVSIILPALSDGDAVNQIDRFKPLGSSIGEIFWTIISHPWNTFKMFFESTLKDPISFGIKKELHTSVLLSGGIALLLRPAYLLMLLPIYAQKMLSDNMALWGINGQYSIEFTPIILLAFIDLLTKVNSNKIKLTLLLFSCLLSVLNNYTTLKERRSFWYDPVTHDFTLRSHYESGGLDVKFLHAQIKQIPDEIPLSVSSCFAPHLANRDKLYHFPCVHNATMIVLLKDKRSLYPLDREKFDLETNRLIKSGLYRIRINQKDLLILEKSTVRKTQF
jgi:uncharacterized membrane protein